MKNSEIGDSLYIFYVPYLFSNSVWFITFKLFNRHQSPPFQEMSGLSYISDSSAGEFSCIKGYGVSAHRNLLVCKRFYMATPMELPLAKTATSEPITNITARKPDHIIPNRGKSQTIIPGLSIDCVDVSYLYKMAIGMIDTDLLKLLNRFNLIRIYISSGTTRILSKCSNGCGCYKYKEKTT